MQFCLNFRILLVALSYFPALLWSQGNGQMIKGRVVDKDTRQPLLGATVVITSLQPHRGTSTDEKGYFRFENVPLGRHDLRVSYLGYEDVKLSQVVVGAGKEVILQLEMQQKIQQIGKVEIRAAHGKEQPLNDMATVSARTFDTEETQRFAASFNDPARMALSFAGVATANDASNEIIIRGNSARGLQWRVEGVEVPNPNHFSNGEGGSGGGISMLSSQVLGRSDFFTGAFPAEYGNAASGVFDIHFRKGNYEKREYALQVGVLGLQAGLEGPFSRKYTGSYLLNYRYSTLKLLNAMGLRLVQNALVPEFQDLSFHLFFPAGKSASVALWGLGGISKAGDVAEKDSLKWQQRSDRFEDNLFQSMGATGFTHTQTLPNKKAYLKVIGAFTAENFSYRLDSLNTFYTPQQAYEERFTYYAARTHAFVNHKFSTRHALRSGLYYTQYFFNVLSAGLVPQTGLEGVFLDSRGNTGLAQAYGQWHGRLSEKVEMILGVHQMWFLLNNSLRTEPRAGLSWRPAQNQKISLGVGLHSRLEPVSTYLIRPSGVAALGEANRSLRPAGSFHAVAGYEITPGRDLHLKTEIYYQHIYKVPVDTTPGSQLSVLNLNAEIPRVVYANRGFGRNYGWELTVEKFFSRHYFFLITASLFQAEYSMGKGQVWRPGRFSAGYLFNGLGGYEWVFGRRRQNTWSLNLRGLWRGGNRFTPIDTAASIAAGREILDAHEVFARRLPAYLRVDFSTALRLNLKKWALGLSLEVQNLTNRRNVNCYFFDPYSQQVRTAYMFGIMPVFNIKAEF